MSNVVQFRPAEYVNCDGKPLALSMKQLVLRGVPFAWCHHKLWTSAGGVSRDVYSIRAPEYESEPANDQGFIGTGATEDAAWRDAYFAISGAK